MVAAGDRSVLAFGLVWGVQARVLATCSCLGLLMLSGGTVIVEVATRVS